ncbi:MAG: DUF4363 family protein, partial [Oscillospiraceae bacterium]
IAAVLLLVIFGLLLLNIAYLDDRTELFVSQIEFAEKLENAGKRGVATKQVEGSLAQWLAWGKYSHIMLRHSEVDQVTDAYFQLIEELESENGAQSAAYARLKEKLHSIAGVEHITFDTVF